MQIKRCTQIDQPLYVGIPCWNTTIMNKFGQTINVNIHSMHEPSDDEVKLWILSNTYCITSYSSYKSMMTELFDEYTHSMSGYFYNSQTDAKFLIDFFGREELNKLSKELEWF